MIHKLRNAGKKIREVQDPKAESDPDSQKAKMRKRDLIKKYADSGLNFIKGVADKVSHNETLQKTAGRVGHAVSEAHAYTGKLVHGLAHKKHDKSGETAEDVQGEEANRYPGWMMERIKTASIGVGFFLKRSPPPLVLLTCFCCHPIQILPNFFASIGAPLTFLCQERAWGSFL